MADLIITPANILPGTTAAYLIGAAGVAVTAGQPVYLDAATNQFKLAKANGTQAEATMKGVTLNPADIGQSVRIFTGGDLVLGTGTGLVVGMLYTLSATAGKFAPITDQVAGWWAVLAGIGAIGNILKVSIVNPGVLRA